MAGAKDSNDGWGAPELHPYLERVFYVALVAVPAGLVWLFVSQGEYLGAIVGLFFGPYLVAALFSFVYGKPTHCPRGHSGQDIVWWSHAPYRWVCTKCRRQRLRAERAQRSRQTFSSEE